MARESNKYQILDIYTAAFLYLHGFEPGLGKWGNRVFFEFPVDKQVEKLMAKYNQNAQVNVLDYTSLVRRLRSQMLSMRE